MINIDRKLYWIVHFYLDFFFASSEWYSNTRVRIFFFVGQSANFFSQNLTLGYMTKTLNQIIFFASIKIRIFFSATLGIRIFFLEKTHNLPLQVKWSFPYCWRIRILHFHKQIIILRKRCTLKFCIINFKSIYNTHRLQLSNETITNYMFT